MKKAPGSKSPGTGQKPGSPKPAAKASSVAKKSDPVKSMSSNVLGGGRSHAPNASTITAGAPSTNPATNNQPLSRDARLQTEADMKKFLNSPDTSPDYTIIAQPKFAEISLVTDNIYLTGMFGLTKEKFERFDIISKSAAAKKKSTPSLIVNATKELPNLIGYECLRVNVDDDRSEDIYPHLKKVVDKMYQTVTAGGKVVVHCMAGVSRSAAIAMAYLIRHRKMTLRTAYLIKFELDKIKTSSTRIIRVRKNGITVEVPDFLQYDLPHKFEEEFSSNRAMNRVPDCGTEELHSEYPLYDLDKGDKIPPPGITTASTVRSTKSNESLGTTSPSSGQDQQH